MGHRSVLCRAGSLLLFPLFLATAYAQESAVLGPVDQVDLTGSSLTVLGQAYAVPTTAVFIFEAKRYAPIAALRLIRLGAYVSVVGSADSNGQIKAQTIEIFRSPYVPGASDVFVSGRVQAVEPLTGVARVGGLRIDTTTSLGDTSSANIRVGSRVEVLGKQAASGGVLWVSGLKVLDSVETESISGTGNDSELKSISGTGTGVKSISGTGAGTELKSISGTGAGTELKSISGTGTGNVLKSISGTGNGSELKSISGTGIGSELKSISGTGSGSELKSISGTGTGSELKSISGTGSGSELNSISGTGNGVLSISGTGTALQSISGTGIQDN